jgi:hypothetical protein
MRAINNASAAASPKPPRGAGARAATPPTGPRQQRDQGAARGGSVTPGAAGFATPGSSLAPSPAASGSVGLPELAPILTRATPAAQARALASGLGGLSPSLLTPGVVATVAAAGGGAASGASGSAATPGGSGVPASPSGNLAAIRSKLEVSPRGTFAARPLPSVACPATWNVTQACMSARQARACSGTRACRRAPRAAGCSQLRCLAASLRLFAAPGPQGPTCPQNGQRERREARQGQGAAGAAGEEPGLRGGAAGEGGWEGGRARARLHPSPSGAVRAGASCCGGVKPVVVQM